MAIGVGGKTVVHFKRDSDIGWPLARRVASLESLGSIDQDAVTEIDRLRVHPVPCSEEDSIVTVYSPQPLQALLPNRIDRPNPRIVDCIELIAFFEKINKLNPPVSVSYHDFNYRYLMNACLLLIPEVCREDFETHPMMPEAVISRLAKQVDLQLFASGRPKIPGWDSARLIRAWSRKHCINNVHKIWAVCRQVPGMQRAHACQDPVLIHALANDKFIHDILLAACDLGFTDEQAARKLIKATINMMLNSCRPLESRI